MEATMKIMTLNRAERAWEYTSAVLMDLSCCPAKQVLVALIKLTVRI